ncbi:alanine racemase [Microbacterium sp. B2969]|uniref:Alanine racemase n=1 Tax=Microbacterium alkaliflavum TaxID=3248839 RepID=A0ABW7QAZ1_9MICO
MTPAAGWVEVDTRAIAHNLDVVRAHLADGVELCAVLKADAYGHGVDLVAPVVIGAGVRTIGVTSNGEARMLRGAGFDGRILRLRPALAEEITDGASHAIEEWVGGEAHAKVVQDASATRGRRIPVHVALNSTGLSRDGIPLDTAAGRRAIEAIGRMPGLDVVGVCAHFPCEDVDDVERGARDFAAEAGLAVEALGVGDVGRHCATTFAALSVPDAQFDMVRIGAALYGDSALLGGRLRPAMRVVSRIAALNGYPAGATAGYGRAHRLATDARLGVVPLGYADGYRRGLGRRAEVLVRGRRAPVVDRLAMNTLLVDVSAIEDARIGDEVVVYGAQGSDAITSTEIERVTGEIAADLYTAWGRLLPRRSVVGVSIG